MYNWIQVRLVTTPKVKTVGKIKKDKGKIKEER